jgi:hypothetical protein
MKSRVDPAFWKLYHQLPRNVRQLAAKAYQLWREDPNHPGLRFKRVDPIDPIYSVRIGLNYRALGWLEHDTVVWFWISDHDEYDRILG